MRLLILRILISVSIGVLGTHYVEIYELPYATKLRDIIFYQGQRIVATDSGIPKTKYRSLDGLVENPVHVAQTVLSDCQLVLAKKYSNSPSRTENMTMAKKGKIVEVANWFIRNAIALSYKGINAKMIPYRFGYAQYNLTAPWYSGMAQGHAVEVLLTAYHLTGKTKFKNAAYEYANGLRIPVDRGGTLVEVKKGVWFEEYASQEYAYNSSLVLNGHIYAMQALYWLKKEESFPWAALFESACKAIAENIRKYYSLGWSYYDLKGTIANGKYHRLHIQLLDDLARTCKENSIVAAREHFRRRLWYPLGIVERLIFARNRMILFLCFINSLVVFFAWFSIDRAIKSMRA